MEMNYCVVVKQEIDDNTGKLIGAKDVTEEFFQLRELKNKPARNVDDGLYNTEMLTAEEAARYMKVSVGTIYNWKRRGMLIAGRDYVGNRKLIRYKKSALDRIINTGG